MANRRFHYDRAFEHYLRANGVAYVAVDEAKRALHAQTGQPAEATLKLKSFDFVVYSQAGANLLVDVKGRKHAGTTGKQLQNWVTRDDVKSLQRWAELFGAGFEPAFCFLFWCDTQPPDALFLETFEYDGRWYAQLAIKLGDYVEHQRDRSAKWDTVSIPAEAFHRFSVPIGEML